MRPAPAFTLLELVVGTTMSLAIAGFAMSTLLATQSTQRETQLKNAVTRDAMYMLDSVGGDLALAGVGVPYGGDVEGLANSMRPVFRVAAAQQMTFLGDLPLPNSDFNGLATVANVGTADNRGIAVSSELTLCPPPSGGGGYVCNTARHGLVPIAATDADLCDPSNLATRTCPWALGKWQPTGAAGAQDIIVSSASGVWAQRRLPYSGATPASIDVGNFRGVLISNTAPNGYPGGLDGGTFVTPRIGTSFISTVDRVFYSVEREDNSGTCTATDRKCKLFRRHCWGTVADDSSAGFPAAGSPPLNIGAIPAACDPPLNGTRWEPVANNLESLTFRYFDRDGIELTTPVSNAELPNIAAVDVELIIARVIGPDRPDTLLRQRMQRRFFVEAGDGFGTGGRR